MSEAKPCSSALGAAITNTVHTESEAGGGPAITRHLESTSCEINACPCDVVSWGGAPFQGHKAWMKAPVPQLLALDVRTNGGRWFCAVHLPSPPGARALRGHGMRMVTQWWRIGRPDGPMAWSAQLLANVFFWKLPTCQHGFWFLAALLCTHASSSFHPACVHRIPPTDLGQLSART